MFASCSKQLLNSADMPLLGLPTLRVAQGARSLSWFPLVAAFLCLSCDTGEPQGECNDSRTVCEREEDLLCDEELFEDEVPLSSSPEFLTAIEDHVYFMATGPDGVRGWWRVNNDSEPEPVLQSQGLTWFHVLLNGKLYATGLGGWHELDPSTNTFSRLPGAPAMTAVQEPRPQLESEGSTVVWGEAFYYVVAPEDAAADENGRAPQFFHEDANPFELWRFDGTAAVRLLELPTGTARHLTPLDGSLYFATEGKVWRFDGADAHELLNADVSSCCTTHLFTAQGILYFTLGDLYRYDPGTDTVESIDGLEYTQSIFVCDETTLASYSGTYAIEGDVATPTTDWHEEACPELLRRGVLLAGHWYAESQAGSGWHRLVREPDEGGEAEYFEISEFQSEPDLDEFVLLDGTLWFTATVENKGVSSHRSDETGRELWKLHDGEATLAVDIRPGTEFRCEL